MDVLHEEEVVEESHSDEVDLLRNYLREERKVLWKKQREVILRTKRSRLSEEEELQEVITLKKFNELLEDLKGKKCTKQTLQQIKRAATQGENFIEEFVKFNGAIYALVGQLTSQCPEHQLQAAECITNLALGDHKTTSRILKASSAYLIVYLHSRNYILQDQAAWALGNMAADCDQCSERLKAQGIIPGLLNAMRSPHADVVQSATFALRCFTIHQNGNYGTSEKQELTRILCSFLRTGGIKKEILSNVLFVVFHLCVRAAEWEMPFRSMHVLPTLLCLLEANCCDVLIITPIIRCLGNVAGSGGCFSLVLEIVSRPNFSSTISRLLASNYNHVRRETLWFLSNLASYPNFIINRINLEEILMYFPLCISAGDHGTCDQALHFLQILRMSPRESYVDVYLATPNLVESIQLARQLFSTQSSITEKARDLLTYMNIITETERQSKEPSIQEDDNSNEEMEEPT